MLYQPERSHAAPQIRGMGELVEGAVRVRRGVGVAQIGEPACRRTRIRAGEAFDHRRDRRAHGIVESPRRAAIDDCGAGSDRTTARRRHAAPHAHVDVGAVRDDFPRRVGRVRAPCSRVGGECVADRRIELMPRAAEPAEELDRARVASGDVGGEFLQDAERAGPPAVVDRLRDIEALRPRVQARHEARGEQVADIRHHPIVTGLDRLVLPQPVDASPNCGGLRTDAVEQFLQRAACPSCDKPPAADSKVWPGTRRHIHHPASGITVMSPGSSVK